MDLPADFPTNQLEFEASFGTDAACVAYARKAKWPDGFRCRRCGGTESWSLRERAVLRREQRSIWYIKLEVGPSEMPLASRDDHYASRPMPNPVPPGTHRPVRTPSRRPLRL